MPQAGGNAKQIIDVTILTTGELSQEWSIGFNSIDHLYLIEDMFSFSITGKLKFYDRIGVSEFGPINGFEKVKIKYGNINQDDNYREIIMDIEKINKIERFSDERAGGNNLVELTLADKYYKKWHSHYWSKSWKDTKISDIIKHIAKYHLGITLYTKFEGTNETIPYFDMHQRTPAECISWLMNRASGLISGQPGYVYYHAQDNGKKTFEHNFQTLEKMTSNTDWMKPYDQNGEAVYKFNQENPEYINNIREYKVLTVDLNALKSLSGGTVMGYDIKRKKLIKQKYTYMDAIPKFTILGKYTLFPTEMAVSNPILQVDGYFNEKILDNLWYGNWVKEYSHQQHVHITCNGHPDRKVGGMIRLVWPSHSEKEINDPSSDVFNKQMDGRYMVKSITNYFDKNVTSGWQQKLVLIRNGYKDTINPNLIPAVKKNL